MRARFIVPSQQVITEVTLRVAPDSMDMVDLAAGADSHTDDVGYCPLEGFRQLVCGIATDIKIDSG